MGNELLKIRDLSKKFDIPKRSMGNSGGAPEEFYALRNINFELLAGDVIGIIGDNGAGKTTLLKILSEVLTPTTGTVEYFGRYHSILEIGTGFHPDLSGKENILLNASLFGMSRQEIRNKLNPVIDFSGIREFIDMPVKHYSSGMYLRLAFSVAVFIDAEILFIDEVISVGDAEFRLKSLDKIREKTYAGASVILVSHNLNEIADLCTRCIWLHKGEIIETGNPLAITQAYYQKAALQHFEQLNKEQKKITGTVAATQDAGIPVKEKSRYSQLAWNDVQQAPGNEHVRIKAIAVNPGTTSPHSGVSASHTIEINLEFWKQKSDEELELFLNLSDQLDKPVFVTSSAGSGVPAGSAGLFRTYIHIPGNLLNYGMFSIGFNFIKNRETSVARFPHLLYFTVQPDENGKAINSPGPLRPVLEWKTEKISGI